MRILVVEDDEILFDAVRTGLVLEGFAVDAVDTIADAREAAGTVDYDAVVLDIGLPDGTGLDLLGEWRKAGRSVPVLLLTARNERLDPVQLLAGVDGADVGVLVERVAQPQPAHPRP